MDACLDTLSTELDQVNTRIGCIARQQAHLGGFLESSSPPSNAPEDDDDSDNDDDGMDGDASSSSSNEMSTWHSDPLSLVTKKESSFGYESNLS